MQNTKVYVNHVSFRVFLFLIGVLLGFRTAIFLVLGVQYIKGAHLSNGRRSRLRLRQRSKYANREHSKKPKKIKKTAATQSVCGCHIHLFILLYISFNNFIASRKTFSPASLISVRGRRNSAVIFPMRCNAVLTGIGFASTNIALLSGSIR